MAWTYDSELTADKDKVRFLVGDTDANEKLIEDGEINFALSSCGNDLERAAAKCCRAIEAKLRRELSLTPAAGSVSLDSQAVADGFRDLAVTLEQQAVTSGGAGIFGGGISVSAKKTEDQDSDRVMPRFTSKLHTKRGSMNELTNTTDD